MPAPTINYNSLLTDPGYLWIAPIGTAAPTNTVAGSVFTDAADAAWIPLGPTQDGTSFTYSTEVASISVAELADPVTYVTTSRAGNMSFNLANFTLSNYRRALNGGIAALTASSGTGATALYTVEPPEPGSEVRAMLLWESLDQTVRIFARQVLQGGEVTSEFRKTAGDTSAVIPCTFNFEVPTSGKVFSIYGAGAKRA